MRKDISIREFIEKFSEFNSDLPGECVEAVLMRLFETTAQSVTPYNEFCIMRTFEDYFANNGNKYNKAILDTAIDYMMSERQIRTIVDKLRSLNIRRQAS